MTQVMALIAKKLAAETETHLRQHYEKFCRKWYKWTEQDDDEEDDNENFLDPDTAELADLVRGAWRMRGDLEALPNPPKGFALFP